MTLISKKVYLDKLADIVNKYINMSYSTIRMKHTDVKSSAYIGFGIGNNNKDPKFKVGYRVTITNYKNVFTKGYILNWSE